MRCIRSSWSPSARRYQEPSRSGPGSLSSVAARVVASRSSRCSTFEVAIAPSSAARIATPSCSVSASELPGTRYRRTAGEGAAAEGRPPASALRDEPAGTGTAAGAACPSPARDPLRHVQASRQGPTSSARAVRFNFRTGKRNDPSHLSFDARNLQATRDEPRRGHGFFGWNSGLCAALSGTEPAAQPPLIARPVSAQSLLG
jgi:hypothetical protein